MNKCVFLDRDGVLNKEVGTYVYRPEEFVIPAEVPRAVNMLKEAGFKLVVVTNQAGIARGLYTGHQVVQLHQILQQACNDALDALYFCPYHPKYDSESLSRKPGSLMLEKAIARFAIDPRQSWMVGDRPRDLEAARRVQVKGIFISNEEEQAPDYAHFVAGNLLEAARFIIQQ